MARTDGDLAQSDSLQDLNADHIKEYIIKDLRFEEVCKYHYKTVNHTMLILIHKCVKS